MPPKNKKHLGEDKPARKRKHSAIVDTAPPPTAVTDESDELDMVAGEFESGPEPDQQEIDSLTDRIFGSVLERYGWSFQGGRVEHVGEDARRRSH